MSFNEKVEIKVYYENKSDIRRLRIFSNEFTLNTLKQKIISISPELSGRNPDSLKISYKDNEGDWVVLNSNSELEDALSIYVDPNDTVLRVKVMNDTSSFDHFSNFQSQFNERFQNLNVDDFLNQVRQTLPQFASEFENLGRRIRHELSNGSGNDAINEITRRLNEYLTPFNTQQQQQSRQQPQENNSGFNSFQNPPTTTTTTSTTTSSSDQKTKETQIPTSSAEPSSSSASSASSSTRSTTTEESSEPVLPNDSLELIEMAVRLMDKNELDRAEKVLFHAKEIKPSHPLVFYNLACISSLRKNGKEALEYFRKAVKNGYSNIQWALDDGDLEYIRNHNRNEFNEIIKSMEPFYHFYMNMNTPQQQQQQQQQQQRPYPGQNQPSFPVQFHQSYPGQQTQTQTPPVEPQRPLYPGLNANELPNEEVNQTQENQRNSELKTKWQNQLEMLRSMGINNDEKSVQLLELYNGELPRVLQHIFE